MTAPLFYTIAQPRKDEAPILVSVWRTRGHLFHGIRETGQPGTIAVKRTDCTGTFAMWNQAQAAITMATAVFEAHQLTIATAIKRLERARRALAADMRRRITAMPGENSLRG